VTDPKRWAEAGESSELERELLLAGQSARMPESERRALWAGIASSLSLVPPPSGVAPAPASASSGLSAYFVKGLIFLAAVGGITLGALQLRPSAEPRTRRVETVLAMPTQAAPSVRPSSVPPAELPLEPAAAAAVPSHDAKPRALPASQLREESEAILMARAALRAGDAARSLSLLEQARLRYPRGALGQEREALTIQALAKSGARAAAVRRARAFLRAHPQSPYAADVRLVAAE
jgi:hypothetical protein